MPRKATRKMKGPAPVISSSGPARVSRKNKRGQKSLLMASSHDRTVAKRNRDLQANFAGSKKDVTVGVNQIESRRKNWPNKAKC